jgi:hypothetical protein
MNDKKIKRIIEEVVKKKLKSNFITKDYQLVDKAYLTNKFKLNEIDLKLKTNTDIKDTFRYIENNNVIPRSVDIIYQTFVNEKNFDKCSGYELMIDPLYHIQIVCSKSKYENLLKNNERVKKFLENPNPEILKVYSEDIGEFKELDYFIHFYFNINENYEKTLNIVADLLSEIFSLCDNLIIPLQVSLVVYNDRNLREENDEISGYHRTFIVFKKENNMYRGYYYDPEGYQKSYYTNTIYQIIQKLQFNKLEIKTIHASCPIGIQQILKDVDIGLCSIYSLFWYHCFIEILYIIKKYEKHSGKTDLSNISLIDYISFLNECIIKIPFKMHLEQIEDNYNIDYKNPPNLNNKMILNIYLNYALYVIGYTIRLLNKDDKNKLLKYIKEYESLEK